MKASEIFRRGWVMSGLPKLRPSSRTYENWDFSALPPIPKLGPNLSWLTPLHPQVEEQMRHYRPQDEERNMFSLRRDQVLGEALASYLSLPESFVTLTSSFLLQDRIPSCTACYFELPERIVNSPFRAGDYIVRFLNDQQVCVCWYLYLPADESPFVLSSSGDGDSPFLDTIDFEKRPSSIESARKHATLAAASFDEFLYRFWIENSIWFHLTLKLSLTPAQLEYVRFIEPNYLLDRSPGGIGFTSGGSLHGPI